MKRILLLADIHANTPALAAVVQDVGVVDAVVNAGDIVDYGPWPLEAVAAVRELQGITVMGNHDRDCATGTAVGYNPYAMASCRWTYNELPVAEKLYLRQLPRGELTTVEGVVIFVCHGSPRNPLDEYVTPDYPTDVLQGLLATTHAQVLVLGHTHLPLLRSIRSDRVVVNPGSVGQPRDGNPKASYAVLTVDDSRVLDVTNMRVEYDVDSVADSIMKVGLPAFLAERLYYGI